MRAHKNSASWVSPKSNERKKKERKKKKREQKSVLIDWIYPSISWQIILSFWYKSLNKDMDKKGPTTGLHYCTRSPGYLVLHKPGENQ